MSLESARVRFRESFLTTQDKRWQRIVDAISALLPFASAVLALHVLHRYPTHGAGHDLLVTICLISMVSAPPLAYVLYRKSDLRKYERMFLVVFMLSTSLALIVCTIDFTNT